MKIIIISLTLMLLSLTATADHNTTSINDLKYAVEHHRGVALQIDADMAYWSKECSIVTVMGWGLGWFVRQHWKVDLNDHRYQDRLLIAQENGCQGSYDHFHDLGIEYLLSWDLDSYE
jgi:hypothetical protein